MEGCIEAEIGRLHAGNKSTIVSFAKNHGRTPQQVHEELVNYVAAGRQAVGHGTFTTLSHASDASRVGNRNRLSSMYSASSNIAFWGPPQVFDPSSKRPRARGVVMGLFLDFGASQVS